MNFKDIILLIVNIILGVITSILSLYLLINSAMYRTYVFYLGYSISRPFAAILGINSIWIAAIIHASLTFLLLINYLYKRRNHKVEFAARFFTFFVFLIILIAIISYSSYPVIQSFLISSSTLSVFFAFLIGSIVVTVNLSIRYISSQDRFSKDLKKKGADKDDIYTYQFQSYGYTLLISGIALIISITIYLGAQIINDRFYLYLSGPMKQILILIAVVSLALAAIYLFIGKLLTEE
ncbi:MAG: hypothetical protein ACLFVB_04280 [Thermoplasmata archaeon]